MNENQRPLSSYAQYVESLADYFESEEFKHYWEKIVNDILWNGAVTTNCYLYKTRACPIDVNILYKILSSMSLMIPKAIDDECNAWTYNGIGVTVMIGQGCNYYLSVDRKETDVQVHN